MAKQKLSNTEQVDQYIAQLSAEIRPTIEYLRQLMLSIDENITEHNKWNSPAFYYAGEMKDFDPKEYKRDILVMNLRNNQIKCVLPTGMKIQNNVTLLEGDYTDGRRIIHFKNLQDMKHKETNFKEAIKEWLSLVEK